MIGKTVSHYTILEKIGEGGMGVVYKAEDTKLKRTVALKFLPSELTRDAEAKARFIHEAQAAAALNHPNIVTIYEIGEHEGQIYIAMEYVEGQTLKELISVGADPRVCPDQNGNQKKGEHPPVKTPVDSLLPIAPGPLPLTQIIAIASQIAAGLSAAHVKGIVHRDLKPANVMLTDEGSVKIVDFGLAKLKGLTRLTKSGTTLGTVAYMSPEQALGKEVDQRTDIWSLGVILYEMLTGKPPFPGEYDQAVLYAVINEEPELVIKVRPETPPGLERIVGRALAKDPAKRYQAMEKFLADLRTVATLAPHQPGRAWRLLKKPFVVIPAILVLAAIVLFSIRIFDRQAKQRWARNELLPRISQMTRGRLTLDLVRTYELALAAEKYIPRDPRLAAIFEEFSIRFTIKTDPPGAKVYFKYYQEPEKEWDFLGVSPIKNLRVPYAFLRFKMEKEGYEPVLAAAASWGKYDDSPQKYSPGEISVILDKKGVIPAGMVRVSGGEIEGIGKIEDFYMDRFEVTNSQYRGFILKGGYQKQEHWKNTFIKEGKPLTWEQAMATFVDKTGLPGPATWQAGDYPEGEDDYPVSGISWYEAAAYAEYAGKTLPSGYHWTIARGNLTTLINNRIFNELFIPQSNFRGKGPEPVGRNPAITAYGLCDMGGNVREWCFNETHLGRLIRGGAWNDVAYMFSMRSQLSPFDRSAKNGFRCCLYIRPEKVPKAALALVKIEGLPDYSKLNPISDPIFQVYREQYAYDKSALDPKLEFRDDSAKEWIVEKVSFAAAYENERIPAFLYLPKSSAPPFQAIIFFGGSNTARSRSSKFLEKLSNEPLIPPLLKNGRAVMFPIYKGTYERGSDSLAAIHDGVYTRQYTEYFIKVVKDFSRSIDYLETRPEIDTKKLAYLGFSWGGTNGAIIPAVEDRLKASVLNVGGWYGTPRPEVHGINYITRVKIPTLMLNGKYDMTYPFEFSVKPMFDMLGTPKADKRLIVYDTDHIIPINEFIRETIKWLDKYLGPVQR